MKHTPLPWVAHGCTIAMADNWRDGNNLGGGTVAITYQLDADECPVDEMIGNAEFICRAVNSHQALLAACRQAAEAIRRLNYDGTMTEQTLVGLMDAQRASLAAIAQATGNATTPAVSGNLNQPLTK